MKEPNKQDDSKKVIVFNVFWPSLEKPEHIEHSIRIGVYACVFVAASTAMFTGFRMLPTSMWINVVLFILLAVGIRFRWREAAFFALGYFVVQYLFMLPQKGVIGTIVSIPITLFLISSLRATTIYHERKQEEARAKEKGALVDRDSNDDTKKSA